jgi:hypothetical protein
VARGTGLEEVADPDMVETALRCIDAGMRRHLERAGTGGDFWLPHRELRWG